MNFSTDSLDMTVHLATRTEIGVNYIAAKTDAEREFYTVCFAEENSSVYGSHRQRVQIFLSQDQVERLSWAILKARQTRQVNNGLTSMVDEIIDEGSAAIDVGEDGDLSAHAVGCTPEQCVAHCPRPNR